MSSVMGRLGGAIAEAAGSASAAVRSAADAAAAAASNALVAGIAVKNESELPILVICSQVTPLHWGKIMPGETWNVHNVLGMSKVWFTVCVTPWDPKKEPTAAGVAASLAAVAIAVPLVAAPLVLGGAASLAMAPIMGIMATDAGTTAAASMGAAVFGTLALGGGGAICGGASVAAATIKMARALVGIRRDGVYSDGSTLVVRGKLFGFALGSGEEYRLFFASADEQRAHPYSGPPSPAELERIMEAFVREE